MSRLHSVLCLIATFLMWLFVVHPAFAIIGVFLLPIGLFATIFTMGGTIFGAIVGTIVFSARSGSYRQLKRFVMTVYLLTAGVGLPINTLFREYDMYGSPLAVIMILLVICPSYAGGYYLVYENGYQQVKQSL